MKSARMWILWLLCSVFIESAMAQFTNTYPRTGVFHWGGGAPPEWFAQYDFIMSSSTSTSFAQAVKAINPTTVIVATRDINGGRQAVETLYSDWICVNSAGEYVTIYGGGSTLADLTSYCPKVNGIQYNDAVISYMSKLVDLDVFDGIATDGFWGSPWGNATVDIDLDRNGVNDNVEHGRDWVVTQWAAGAEKIVAGLDAALPAGKIFVINGNSFETNTSVRSGFNGFVFEYGGRFSGTKWYSGYSLYTSLMSGLEEPHAIYIDGCTSWKNLAETTNIRDDFQLMRYILATALLGDGFVGYQIEYKDHYLMSYYDEFDVKLGMPTSSANKTMTSGSLSVFVRFFENGVVVLNTLGQTVTFSDANLKVLTGYDGPYYFFEGGQNPDRNNGSIFSSISLAGQTLSGGVIYYGDALILTKTPQTVVSDIIIDNSDFYTSPGCASPTFVGTWTQEGGSGMWHGGYWKWLGAYADRYSLQGDGSNYAVYSPTISVDGSYELYEWHGTSSATTAAAIDVPFTLTVGGKQIVKLDIDQTQNLSKWNSLGQYYFVAGTTVQMTISNDANGTVVADAFKLVYKGEEKDDTPPLSPTSLQRENATYNTIRLSWQAPLAASDGDTAMFYVVFRNNSSIGITYQTYYEDKGLTENTQYSYKIVAYDNSGNACTTPLTGTLSTLADLTGPKILSVQAVGSVIVEVVFDEAVEQTSAETITNYTINKNSTLDKDVTVTKAVLDVTSSNTVTLTTTQHTVGTTYDLTVTNVKDLSTAANKANDQKEYATEAEPIMITVAVDNEYQLYVNGTLVGSGSTWSTGMQYEVTSITGKNVIAIKGIDTGGYAGLVAEIEFMGNTYVSNDTWKVSTVEETDWYSVSFDDLAWAKATSYGLHGTATPWASYKNVTNISTTSGVNWIWSSDWDNDNTVYFRYTLQTDADITPPAAPQNVQVIIE